MMDARSATAGPSKISSCTIRKGIVEFGNSWNRSRPADALLPVAGCPNIATNAACVPPSTAGPALDDVGLGTGTAVGVGVPVAAGFGVAVGVGVGVMVAVAVGVWVGVAVALGVAVLVGVAVGPAVGVCVGV